MSPTIANVSDKPDKEISNKESLERTSKNRSNYPILGFMYCLPCICAGCYDEDVEGSCFNYDYCWQTKFFDFCCCFSATASAAAAAAASPAPPSDGSLEVAAGSAFKYTQIEAEYAPAMEPQGDGNGNDKEKDVIRENGSEGGGGLVVASASVVAEPSAPPQ